MARIENGNLIGKLGNIVGTTNNGKAYVKRRPVRTAPLTEGEQKNLFIFNLVGQWLKPILPYIRIGFQGYNNNFQGYNAAKSLLFKSGLNRNGYDSSIDPSIVLVSYGTLGLPENLQVELQEQVLHFTWDPAVNSNKGPRDRIMLLAYNIEKQIAAYELSGQKRMEASAQLSLENYKPGTYHIYAAFMAEDGSRQSNSRYLGIIVY